MLGDYVKTKRKELKLTREELASKVGITSTEIYRIERGDRKKPSLKVLTGLADALGVTVDDIVQNSEFAKEGERSLTEIAFPALKNENQRKTVELFAASLARNGDLTEKNLEELMTQVDMYLQYAAKN